MILPAIWTAMYLDRGAPAALRTLHALGWQHFELSFEHLLALQFSWRKRRWIAEICRTLMDLGATMPQAHAFLPANVAHPNLARRRRDLAVLWRQLPLCRALGTTDVVVHPGTGRGYTTAEEYAALRQLNVLYFSRLAARAETLGLTLALENMADSRRTGRRHFGARPEDLLDLIATIGSPALAVTLDTSHAHVQGLDIPAAIRQFGPHLRCLHISDNDGSGDQHRTPGNGAIDWPPIIAALREIGYQGLFDLEIPGEEDRDLEARAANVRHAREVVGEMLRVCLVENETEYRRDQDRHG
jgi:sugar phosphate isomerase/epimerase